MMIYLAYKHQINGIRMLFICSIPSLFVITFNAYAKLVTNETLVNLLDI
jgi:hypothetical protein